MHSIPCHNLKHWLIANRVSRSNPGEIWMKLYNITSSKIYHVQMATSVCKSDWTIENRYSCHVIYNITMQTVHMNKVRSLRHHEDIQTFITARVHVPKNRRTNVICYFQYIRVDDFYHRLYIRHLALSSTVTIPRLYIILNKDLSREVVKWNRDVLLLVLF